MIPFFLAAEAQVYILYLTDEILAELQRNLVNKRRSSEKQVTSLIETIQRAFREHFVEDYQQLIALMPVNEKDRHVLAAAVASKSHIIVTNNLKDFPPHLLSFYEIEAQSPDTFLTQLFAENPHDMKKILFEQADNLRNPPLSVFEVLDRLELEAPHFVRVVRELF